MMNDLAFNNVEQLKKQNSIRTYLHFSFLLVPSQLMVKNEWGYRKANFVFEAQV